MDEQMSDAKESMAHRRRVPIMVSIIVAVFGVLAMLVVDHGPWSIPHLKTAMVNYGNTHAAAKAAGAIITPTVPRSPIEPEAAGPKRAQPVDKVAP
jgi:phosphotransferase system  glucose/maltose/N-acetylglucosamine-specific IIC component